MQVNEIVEQLRFYGADLPKEALQAAVEKQSEITPILLKAVQSAVNNGVEENESLYLYGLFLLSQFRCTDAAPLVSQMLLLPEEKLDLLLGDILTENMKQIIASTYSGDLSYIKEIIENPNAFEYARSTALCSIPLLVKHNLLEYSKAIQYFSKLLEKGFEGPRSKYLYACLVCNCCDLSAKELLEPIQEAFRDEKVDKQMIGLDEATEDLVNGSKYDYVGGLIDDAASEVGVWIDTHQEDEDFTRAILSSLNNSINTPYLNPNKIGRNAPCFCGSGKKYKKCCLNASNFNIEYNESESPFEYYSAAKASKYEKDFL